MAIERPPLFPRGPSCSCHHLCQAYVQLYLATGDERVKEALRQMAQLVADTLYDPQLRNLKTIVDKEGARVGTHQSFGHDCEISYLILRVAELVGEEALTQRLRSQMTDVLRNVLENDFDPYHSLYNGCDLETGVREPSHVWWAQAEAVTGHAVRL